MSDSRIPSEPVKTGHAYQIGGDGSGRQPPAEQAGSPFLTIPGFNAPTIAGLNAPADGFLGNGGLANIPRLGDFNHIQGTFSFGQEIIPTLKPGMVPNPLDQTVYSRSSETARVFDNNHDSVVEIYGPPKDPTVQHDFAASGFFLDDHGDIATAYHVVRDIAAIHVDTADGVKHEARIVSCDPDSDVAIISIDAGHPTQAATLAAKTDDLQAGDSLTAIGHPNGWGAEFASPGHYLGSGPLASLTPPEYFKGVSAKQQMLVTDMNTQFGNSGSPVFNAKGEVVGLLDRGNGSYSYLIPAASIRAVAQGRSASALPAAGTGARTDATGGQPLLPVAPADRLPSNHAFYVGAVLTGGSHFFPDGHAFKGYAARIGTVLSGAAGLEDFLSTDRKSFLDSFSSGSPQDKFRSSVSLASDGLLVGAAMTGFIPSLRAASVGISLAGTALKIGNSAL